MTDMPEKIAAWRFVPEKADEWIHGGWSEDHDHKTQPYIRADLSDALVAAETQFAFKAGYAVAGSDTPYSSTDEAYRDWRDPDTRTALDALLKAERERALREAHQNLRAFAPHEEHNTGPEHDIGYARGYHTAMNRVLALIEKDKADG